MAKTNSDSTQKATGDLSEPDAIPSLGNRSEFLQRVSDELPAPPMRYTGLVACPACDGKVSPAAPSCPKCGHPFRRASPPPPKKRSGRFPIYFFAIILILWGLSRLSTVGTSTSDKSSSPDTTPTYSPKMYVAGKYCQAGTSEENIERYVQLAIDKDVAAEEKMIIDGDVVIIPEGEEVYADGSGGFTAGLNDLVEFRRQGETTTLWAPQEFLTAK